MEVHVIMHVSVTKILAWLLEATLPYLYQIFGLPLHSFQLHTASSYTHTQSYPLAELRVLVEAATRQRLDDYQFQSVQRKPLDENRHGRQLTLGYYNIKTGDTLFLMKIGFSLEITNPQVGGIPVTIPVSMNTTMTVQYTGIQNSQEKFYELK